mgnify:CR=1 FL=1
MHLGLTFWPQSSSTYILILIPHNLSAEWLPGVLVDTVGAPHHLAPGRGDGRGVERGQPLHHLLHLRQHLVYWPHCTHVRCITGFCPRYIDPALLTMVLQFQAADCTTVRRWVDRIESVWLNPCRVKSWSPFCVPLINYLCPHSGFVNHLSEAINYYVRAEFSQFPFLVCDAESFVWKVWILASFHSKGMGHQIFSKPYGYYRRDLQTWLR